MLYSRIEYNNNDQIIKYLGYMLTILHYITMMCARGKCKFVVPVKKKFNLNLNLNIFF